ncbi:MAG: transcription-repair coupling factor [Chloroflexi bacterium]|nr:transcription-repair coupling factor [Chloroflexota bacterium]
MKLYNLCKYLSPPEELSKLLEGGENRIVLSGNCRSARPLISACLLPRLKGPGILLFSAPEEADEFFEDLLPFLPPADRGKVALFPPRELSVFSREYSPQRGLVLGRLLGGEEIWVITSPVALLEPVPAPEGLRRARLDLITGSEFSMDDLSEKLVAAGYERVPLVLKRGQFSIRGFILDIYPATGEPVRAEFWGDVLESLKSLDLDSQRSGGKIPSVTVFPYMVSEGEVRLDSYLPRKSFWIIDEPEKIRRTDARGDKIYEIIEETKGPCVVLGDTVPQGFREIPFPANVIPAFPGRLEEFLEKIAGWKNEGNRVVLITQQVDRLKEILHERGIDPAEPAKTLPPGVVILSHGAQSAGFAVPGWSLVCLSDREITGGFRRRRFLRPVEHRSTYSLDDLKAGDVVVHQDHGIAKFRGISRIDIEGRQRDFLELGFAGEDRLYVPLEHIELIERYIGVEGREPGLSHMGGRRWKTGRKKVEEAARELAEKMLALHADRKVAEGHAFSKDTTWQHELESSFPFEETPDQATSINEVKSDMESPLPMDRLVCGDAGYGKTEVALRAAFKAVMEGKQAAVLVPTTVLAQQHYGTFISRLSPFPVKVEMLSRFKSRMEQKKIVEGLASGSVDIVIGTHRLLQKDISFNDLGLLVIDEEQRFGVENKNRLRELCRQVDVITMTATPIPRTLYMAMMGVRNMSRIDTPPAERLPVKTYLLPAEPEIIKAAIDREMKRGGQVYLVHNRVQGIERVAKEVSRLVPDAKIAVAHGQMEEHRLEKIMLEFMEGEHDILLCTTIIESGLDIPNVNTIIINNSHQFGLGQLYQLRGRVGRGHHQSYAYLLYPPDKIINTTAEARLETLKEFSDLGSGYQIALRDLEIRGAGNLLGSEQHGFIARVGFSLYCRMLQDAVNEKKGKKTPKELLPPVIDLPVQAYLPDDYVSDFSQKLTVYRRMGAMREAGAEKNLREDLRDRYGPLPPEAENLVRILGIKLLSHNAGIPLIRHREGVTTILLPGVEQADADLLKRLKKKAGGHKIIFSPHQLELHAGSEESLDLLPGIIRVLRDAKKGDTK